MTTETGSRQAATPTGATPRPYGMDLLDFRLPEFTRHSWVTDAAREAWNPRLRGIFEAWMEIEVLTVREGARACAVTMVDAMELPRVAGRNAGWGLSTLPVAIQGKTNFGYSNQSTGPTYGEPFLYRVVVGAPSDVRSFQQAWEECDDEAIGELLGYPACCRAFFREVWVEHGLRDTTWPMAVASRPEGETTRRVELEGPPEANILWRWMGVRAVSHLPCRSDCAATLEVAARNLDVGRRGGHEEALDHLLEILDWPVEWSCLHGIAEIKTPLLKVSASTDATASKFTVRRRGRRYPAEGARGLTFAFERPSRLKLTGSRGFALGLDNPLPIPGADREPESD